MNHGIVVPVSEVLKAEVEEVTLRRRRAGLIRWDDHAPARPEIQLGADHDVTHLKTVGLAFSGGGIRSGSICLGLLQSLYRRGILQHVDYLSTVSGGGYAGAFFSSLVLDSRFPRVNWTPGHRTEKYKTLDILPDASGRQPQSLTPILFGGERLNDPLPFASRWFLGVLLLNLCIFSGLVAAAALLAWLYRLVDMQAPRLLLKEVGVVSDVGRSFFLPLLALLLWLASVALSRYSSRIAWLRTGLFAVFCGALAMGVCSSLTTADVAAPALEKAMESPSAWREKVSNWSDSVGVYLLAALVGALLPYLNPKGLLRSGVRPRNAVEKWTFAIASRAFLFGVPLFLFAYLARENISGFNAQREKEARLHHLHLDKLNTFFERVAWESEKGLQPGAYLWSELRDAESLRRAARNLPAHEALGDSALARIIRNYETILRRDQGIVQGLASAIQLLPWNWPSLRLGFRERVAEWTAREAVAAELNKLLAAPELTDQFSSGFLGLAPIAHHDDGPRVSLLLGEARNVPRDVSGASTTLDSERRRINWELLQAHYGAVVRSKNTVFASVVVDADQWSRLMIGAISLAIFLTSGLLVDLNAVSLHGYYRRKLGELWINELPKRAPGQPKGGYRIPISEMRTADKGAPYHLINGTLNLMRRGAHATRSETARFTFSQRFCGARRTGYARTDFYDGGNVDLADAIGISGAAVNPASVRNPLSRALLLVLNFRLGQWVPNPARRSMGTWWATPIRLFFNWLRFGDPEDRAYCFVTDGGHDENTGIGALLERRCRVIIAVDAEYEFVDFLRLIRVAVAEHGVRIVDMGDQSAPLSFSECKPKRKSRLAKSHFLVARILYGARNGSTSSVQDDGYLILVKPNLTGDEPTELLHYRTENPRFPHDPTLDQFYEPRRFACYRQLGEHLGDRLYDEFFDENMCPRSREGGLWISEDWAPPAEQTIEVPRQFDEATCPSLLEALRSSDERARAVAFTVLDELGSKAGKELRQRAVRTLIDVFWSAHRKNHTSIQWDACKMIAHIGAGIAQAKEFLTEVADGRGAARAERPIPWEIQETARVLLQAATRQRPSSKAQASSK